MDFREPQPYPPNMMFVGTNSFPKTFAPSMMMAPTTARFPLFNNNNNLPHFDLYNNNINNDTLKPCLLASESFKRKRGRPRKYPSPDGNTALGLTSTHVSPSSSSIKKSIGRGRPLGSKNKKIDVLGGPLAANFIPHVLFVEPGEDIAAKTMAFCEQGRRTAIILSANGAISNVTLRYPTEARGVVTYKGNYELISLSGSFQLHEHNSGCTKMSELSVSLGCLDGAVIGGRLAGELIAASTVQVVVGCFTVDGKNSSSNNLKSGPSSTPSSQMLTSGASVTPISHTSEGPSIKSSDDNENVAFSEGIGLYNNTVQPIQNLPMYHHQLWDARTQQ